MLKNPIVSRIKNMNFVSLLSKNIKEHNKCDVVVFRDPRVRQFGLKFENQKFSLSIEILNQITWKMQCQAV